MAGLENITRIADGTEVFCLVFFTVKESMVLNTIFTATARGNYQSTLRQHYLLSALSITNMIKRATTHCLVFFRNHASPKLLRVDKEPGTLTLKHGKNQNAGEPLMDPKSTV